MKIKDFLAIAEEKAKEATAHPFFPPKLNVNALPDILTGVAPKEDDGYNLGHFYLKND
jgi:hypothetical protein